MKGRDRLIGLIIGIVGGTLQFLLLSIFTKAITSGSLTTKNVLLGFLQFFMPIGVLVGVAFLRRQDLLLAGIGIISALIIGALTKFIINGRKGRGGGDNDE